LKQNICAISYSSKGESQSCADICSYHFFGDSTRNPELETLGLKPPNFPNAKLESRIKIRLEVNS